MSRLTLVLFVLTFVALQCFVVAFPIPESFHRVSHLQKRCHHYKGHHQQVAGAAGAAGTTTTAGDPKTKLAALAAASSSSAAAAAASSSSAAAAAAASSSSAAAAAAAASSSSAAAAAASSSSAAAAAASKSRSAARASASASRSRAAASASAAAVRAQARVKPTPTQPPKPKKTEAPKPPKTTDAPQKKRFDFTGEGTWYNPGLGSCGKTNTEDDFIAALNYIQMANGANPNHNPKCGKKILIKGPKGDVVVTLVDTCPGCAYGDIDLSPAAFKKLDDLGVGRIKIDWAFL